MPSASRPESTDPRDIAAWVDSRIESMQGQLIEHIDKKHAEQRQWFLEAFSSQDPARHRLWHERAEENEQERRGIIRSIFRWAAVGGAGAFASFNWDAIKTWLRG